MGDNDIWMKILTGINGGMLVAVISFGFKVVHFLSDISTKTELLWKDYESRMADDRANFSIHRRRRADLKS
jgi:hypothetical protein